MLKNRKTSAAIVGLLDAIKSEGIKPLQEADFSDTAKKIESSYKEVEYEHPLASSNKKSSDEEVISYEIKLIDTEKCKPWYMANRLNEYLTAESCADLIESIQTVGQQIPVVVRKSKDWNGYDLICGARRLFSCKTLGIKVKAAVVELTDKEALVAMDAENRPRADISPYERACDYKRWVENGIYKNYAEIIKSVGLKKSWFSQLIALADIPSPIVKAFVHPSNLKQKWGYELNKLCKQSHDLELKLTEKAISLFGKELRPDQIFRELKSVLLKDKPTDQVWIKNKSGNPLYKTKVSKNGEYQAIFHKSVSKEMVNKAMEEIKKIFET